MRNLRRSLFPAEFDQLGDFLASPGLEEKAMGVSALDGFLTAVAIGPIALRSSVYPAQQDSCFTSLLKVCAASFNPSTMVR